MSRGHGTVGRGKDHCHQRLVGALSDVYAVLSDGVQKTAFGTSHAVVDFEHCVIGVGAHVKDALNAHVAVGADRGRVVDEAFDAGELIFDGCRNRSGEGLGVGAFVGS